MKAEHGTGAHALRPTEWAEGSDHARLKEVADRQSTARVVINNR